MLLLRTLSMELCKLSLDMVDLKTLTAHQRLEKLLLKLEPARSGEKFSEPLPHKPPLRDAEMASLLGVSPEHFSRMKRTPRRRHAA